MELNQDFKEFIALLNAHNVRFLVIGRYIDDLIKAKNNAARPQNIADAHKLAKIKAKMKK